jgi:nitrite reductase/ring-hydroxylating ferredoxin subunit
MAFVKVAKISELKDNPLLEVMVDGNPYAICQVKDQVFAINGTCPHQGGPLGQGLLTGPKIMCPWHAWEFDCRTGQNSEEQDDNVETYPVQIVGDDILIDIA